MSVSNFSVWLEFSRARVVETTYVKKISVDNKFDRSDKNILLERVWSYIEKDMPW